MKIFAELFGQGHSVMAVGDPQQSIYGFRGASAGQLFGFSDHFPAPGDPQDAVSFLTTAWRNDTAILDGSGRSHAVSVGRLRASRCGSREVYPIVGSALRSPRRART